MPVHPKLVGRSCYHRYEITPGLFTPGTNREVDPKRCLDELGIPKDLLGLRVLEIGAWDGAFTFELVRRGGIVTALDIQDPDVTVFNIVRDILNAPVTYVRTSVYELKPGAQEPFDMVVFTGVYYHLKNPALALHRIREVLKDGGRLYIEGASCSDYLGQELARVLPGISQTALTSLIDRLPISVFDAEHKIYSSKSWWFPTTHCLEATLYDSGFVRVEIALKPNAFNNYSHRRLMGWALANPGKPHPGEQQYEHHVYDQDFRSGGLDTVGQQGHGTSRQRLVKRIGHRLRRYLLRLVKRIDRRLRGYLLRLALKG